MTARATRISRRAFLRGIVAVGAASAAGPLLTACGGGEKSATGQASPMPEQSPALSPTAALEASTPSPTCWRGYSGNAHI